MAAISPISALKESDLQIPEGPATGATLREAFRRLFSQLNPFFDGINKLVANGFSLADNVKGDVITGRFSHGVAQQVKLTKLSRAGSALVLSADGQVAIGSPAVQMVQIPPTANYGPLASVTVFFLDSSATSVKCTLILLPEGGQTSTVPAGTIGSAAIVGEVPTGPTTTTNTGDTYTSVLGKLKAGTEAVYVGDVRNMTRVDRSKYTLTDLTSTTKVIFAADTVPDSAAGEAVRLDYVPG